jgi:hypothetical protein
MKDKIEIYIHMNDFWVTWAEQHKQYFFHITIYLLIPSMNNKGVLCPATSDNPELELN